MGTLRLLLPGIAITIFAPALFTFASALFALFVLTATLFKLLLLLLMLLLMLTTRVTVAATKLMKLKAFEPPRMPVNRKKRCRRQAGLVYLPYFDKLGFSSSSS